MTATLTPGIALRDYQLQDVDATCARWADGDALVAGQAATGLGKTTYLAELVRRCLEAGRRPILLAHRDELIDQMRDRIREHVPSASIGVIGAGSKQARRDVTLAMSPTLRGTRAQAAIERHAGGPRWGDVLYDEAHHAASPAHVGMLDWLGVGPEHHDPDRRLLGLSATLTRADRHGLGKVFHPQPAFERGIPWAVEHGWLVRPFGRVVVADHVDLVGAKVRGGDYVDAELGEMVTQDVDQIVAAWREHAADRLTIAFTPNVASAQALAAAFVEAGVAAECVIGTTSTPTRRGMYARLRAGTTRVLVSVMVLTEGWDCPPVSCVLMARPTRLAGLYQQIVGRGLRPCPETGKADCMVLDVVGASRGQRLASLVELYPDAVQDTSELDGLPCADCGDAPCTCPRTEGRDTTGGRRALEGPAVYETVDLLVAESRGAWLATDGGIPFLVSHGPDGRRAAVILPEPRSPTYRVGHIAMRGRQDPQRLIAGATLDQARRVAEQWAIERNPYLAHKASVWRTNAQQVSWRQISEAIRLQIPHPTRYTGRELSELIDQRIMSQRLDVWQSAR